MIRFFKYLFDFFVLLFTKGERDEINRAIIPFFMVYAVFTLIIAPCLMLFHAQYFPVFIALSLVPILSTIFFLILLYIDGLRFARHLMIFTPTIAVCLLTITIGNHQGEVNSILQMVCFSVAINSCFLIKPHEKNYLLFTIIVLAAFIIAVPYANKLIHNKYAYFVILEEPIISILLYLSIGITILFYSIQIKNNTKELSLLKIKESAHKTHIHLLENQIIRTEKSKRHKQLIADDSHFKKWKTQEISNLFQVLNQNVINKNRNDVLLNHIKQRINAISAMLYDVIEDGDNIILKNNYNIGIPLESQEVIINPGNDIISRAYLEKEMIYEKNIKSNNSLISSTLGKTATFYHLAQPIKYKSVINLIIYIVRLSPLTEAELALMKAMSITISNHVHLNHINEETNNLIKQAKIRNIEILRREKGLKENLSNLNTFRLEAERKETKYKQTIQILKSEHKALQKKYEKETQ